MRTKIALCVLAAIGMSSPAMAAIGAINFSLTSGGSSANVIVIEGVGKTFPIEVSFTTDPSGTLGVNRGAAGMVISIDTALPLVDQVGMSLSTNDPHSLTNLHNAVQSHPAGLASTTNGLGFNQFTDGGAPTDNGGDAFKETIDAVGAFMDLTAGADFDFRNAMGNLRFGSMAENVGHPAGDPGHGDGAGLVLMATGFVTVDPATPLGTYVMTLTSQAAKVWDTTSGQASSVDVPGIGDTLTIVVVPEPATMLLLAPVAWAIRRRIKA